MLKFNGVFEYLFQVAAKLHPNLNEDKPKNGFIEFAFLKFISKSFKNRYRKREAYQFAHCVSKYTYIVEKSTVKSFKPSVYHRVNPANPISLGLIFGGTVILY